MPFTHPLAHDAKVYATGGLRGEPIRILVVVTRLVLNRQHEKHKPKQIERLSAAIKDWIDTDLTGISDFLLINRPKKWIGEDD